MKLETIAELVLGPDWSQSMGENVFPVRPNSGPKTRAASMDDPLVQLAAEIGLDPQPSRPGVIEATCPNAAAHSTRDRSGFAFIGDGVCKCHHAACSNLRSADFKQMMIEEYNDTVLSDLANGAVTRDKSGRLIEASGNVVPETGEGFLAIARFEQTPVDGNEVSQELIDDIQSDGYIDTSKSKETEAEKALDRLKTGGAAFFHCPEGHAYVELNGDVLPTATEYGWRGISVHLRTTGRIPTGNGKNALRELMEAEAFAGPCRPVYFRIGSNRTTQGSGHYVNLMDDQDQVVEFDAKGWRIIPKSAAPLAFVNRYGALPMPVPRRATDGLSFFDRLARHVSLPPVLRPNDPADHGIQVRAGLLMFFLAQFRRDGTVPHLFINGPQGSGKTSFARRAKQLTDPDAIVISPSLPSDPAGLFATVNGQTSVVLDNASKATKSEMDLYCALATGSGFQSRKLYTNGERAIITARVSLIFTSISENFVQRADLMDRTVCIALSAMSQTSRKPESELNEAWDRDLPYLLGDLFDLLVKAMSIEGAVKASLQGKIMPRLIDAAILAECAARAMGWPDMLCIDALNRARAEASDRQLVEDAVAQRLRAFLQSQNGKWRGTVGELLTALANTNVPGMDGGLPYSPRGLTEALNRLEGPLREIWNIHYMRHGHGQRGSIIELMMNPPS